MILELTQGKLDQLEYNDSDWSTGYAEFGYGDGDETTVVNFGPDSDDKYISTYFRKVISVDNTDGFQSLRFKVLRDDGVLVYLNGNEIIRDNMPEEQILFQTQATSTVSFSDEEEYYEWDIDVDLIDEEKMSLLWRCINHLVQVQI